MAQVDVWRIGDHVLSLDSDDIESTEQSIGVKTSVVDGALTREPDGTAKLIIHFKHGRRAVWREAD